jgi:CheY-like chemotaxis protein
MALPRVVETAIALFRRGGDGGVQVRLEVEPELPPVAIDAGPIEQALVNVLINARDATRAAGHASGRIDVHVGRTRGEDTLFVRIDDDGTGMSDAVRARVFEPFFTTKEVGQGTGLGLTTAYGIVEEHGGRLECSTREGEGASFTMILPIAGRFAPTPTQSSTVAPEQPRGERVLVIDDEAALRGLVERLLDEAGYAVCSAGTVEQALALLREPPPTSLVLLDRSVSRAPPEQVIEELRRTAPGARVVLFTGASVPPTEEALVEAVLQKPATLDELLALVRRVLDRPAKVEASRA